MFETVKNKKKYYLRDDTATPLYFHVSNIDTIIIGK